jgi:hypothetical protein
MSCLIRDSWLSYAWLTHAPVQWANRDLVGILAGAFPTNGSPGALFTVGQPLPYIYIYIYIYKERAWALFNYRKPRPPTDWSGRPGVQTAPGLFWRTDVRWLTPN